MNIIRPRTHQSSREGITREPGRHVGTILALMLVGGTSVPFGQESPASRVADIFRRFCIETFPGCIPSP